VIKRLFTFVFLFLALGMGMQGVFAQIIPQGLFPSLKMDAGLASQPQLAAELQAAVAAQQAQGGGGGAAPSGGIAPRDQFVVVSPAAPGSVFGSQLFGGTFRGTLNQGFNSDYVVAIGDRLLIRLWGGVNQESSMTVDGQGNIFIPNVGPIPVSGVRSGDLNAVVERAVHRTYKSNTNVYAALDNSQPVKVFVTGFVRQPGLYGGVASDSPISFLDKAGGVDQSRGSYIDIVVKRGGTVRKRINLYAFLLEGGLDVVQFQDGDVIVVGPRQHAFNVGGEVLNAFDFEFADSSIPLKRALDMARVKPGATHVSIVRRQGSERRTEYHPIADAGQIVLNDGDAVSVSADRYAGTIQVRVEGAHSGEHAVVLPYGAKLGDVIKQLRPNEMSRLDAIHLYRKSVQARQEEMLKVALQKVEEAALSARSMTSEEAALRSREAELLMRFVERAKQVKPKGLVVLAEDQRNETLLEDGDVLVIPERTSLVMVYGEVVFPNAVSWSKGKDIGDYIGLAGGFTQSANTSKIVVVRQNGETQLASASSVLEPGDEVMVLPRIETKSIEVTKALTQILYQIAFAAKIAFGL